MSTGQNPDIIIREGNLRGFGHRKQQNYGEIDLKLYMKPRRFFQIHSFVLYLRKTY